MASCFNIGILYTTLRVSFLIISVVFSYSDNMIRLINAISPCK